MNKPKQIHRNSIGAALDGIEAGGYSGLVTAVYRMIGENQPSIDCIRKADVDFAGAQTAELVWDAALDFASCLKDAKLEPEVPEPPPPPPEPDRTHSVADVVLAALLAHLRSQGTIGDAAEQHIQVTEPV